MNADDAKQAWQEQTSQTRLRVDAEQVLDEVRRKEQQFTAMIFWRDVREIGASLLLVPLWIYLGVRHSSPWTSYLMVPALLWIAGFMLVDRRRHQRQPPEPGEPLRQRVASVLAQLDHQIWLLRNVFWWALLPLALAGLAFFAQFAWQERWGGWWTALGVSIVVAFGAIVLAGVYWLNQYAVRCELEPRRQELEALLLNFQDETPPGNS
jgi:hypothetical protein